MKKVLRNLKKYTLESVLGPVFKLLEASFELMVPLVVLKIVDVGIPAGNNTYIFQMFLVLLLFAALGFGCTLVAQYFAAKAATGFARDLRQQLFAKIQSLSFAQIDRVGTTTLISRMTTDVDQLQNGVNLTLRLFLRSPFVVFGAMIMAFTIDVNLALIFAVVIPVLAVVVFGIMAITIPMHSRVRNNLDKVSRKARENLTGARVIRAFNLEDSEYAEFAYANQVLTKSNILVGRFTAAMNPLTYLIINCAIVLLIKKGAITVETGVITQGGLIALYNYMSQILVELIKLANLIVNITRSMACGRRIEVVLDLESAPSGSVNVSQETGTVEFQNVSMSYSGAEVLSNVSFKANRGETIGIIGGTGSGKSTLVSLIAGYYQASSGTIKIDGIDIDRWNKEELNRRVSTVMQEAKLFSGTIRDNLQYGGKGATDQELMKAVSVAQAIDVVESKGGLDGKIFQGGKNLSGGQRSRLSIARSIAACPEILILDDSSAALDYITDYNLRCAISALNPKPTTFVVSQRTSAVANADKIIVLDEGRVVGIGTHLELLSTCDVYREIHDSQFSQEVSHG